MKNQSKVNNRIGEVFAKIKLQKKVFSNINKQENKIKENKRHKQMLYKILIKDNREPFKVIQKNNQAKLNYKSE